jgi:Protein of unknown function (DUF2924)
LSVATVVATTWLRVSSSDVIGGAGRASVNGMDRQHGRKGRRARSNDHSVRRGIGLRRPGPFVSREGAGFHAIRNGFGFRARRAACAYSPSVAPPQRIINMSGFEFLRGTATSSAEALFDLSVSELKDRWRSVYGTAPPPRSSRKLLVSTIAYRMQERVFGGPRRRLTAAGRKRLSELMKKR